MNAMYLDMLKSITQVSELYVAEGSTMPILAVKDDKILLEYVSMKLKRNISYLKKNGVDFNASYKVYPVSEDWLLKSKSEKETDINNHFKGLGVQQMLVTPGDYKCVRTHENVQEISIDELLAYKKEVLKKGLKTVVTGEDEMLGVDWRDICVRGC